MADGPQLVELPQPTLLDSKVWVPTLSPLALTPQKHISLYDDAQWEEFVLEWATCLQPEYAQVMRNGGANDHGVDVAGLLTDSGFDGEWDCYQCKHYAGALVPSDAYPEILKIVLGVLSGHFTWPRRYKFAAPKGCGTTLAPIIRSPEKLRAALTLELTKERSVLVKKIGQHELEEVLAYIASADFTGFGTVELHEMVAQHSVTRWHAARFGVILPERPEAENPPTLPNDHEQIYIAKLLNAYAERYGEEFTPEGAAGHGDVGPHYVRQRIAFYSAETLRLFARDSVPDGTFDALQDEIYDGVIDIHDQAHADGFERLHEVTREARGLAITANGLLPVVELRDRTGICHQLANDERLSWCHADAQ